jgi:lysozyme
VIDSVIDVSQYQGAVDFKAVRASGILAVIIKATEGTTYTDPSHSTYQRDARQAGLLCGAYHFGRHGDGAAQADHFLKVVGPDERTLLALDLEWVMRGQTKAAPMTLAQVERFVERVYDATGRWPGLYTSAAFLNEYRYKSPTLARSWLWVAQYTTAAAPKVPAIWGDWTLWQYTDSATVKGITPHVDRNRFNGTPEELTSFWLSGISEIQRRALVLSSELRIRMPIISRLFDRCGQYSVPFLCFPPSEDAALPLGGKRTSTRRSSWVAPGDQVRIFVEQLPGGPTGTAVAEFVNRLRAELGPHFDVQPPDPVDGLFEIPDFEDRFVHVSVRRSP